jgi:hypothetical protein
MIPNNRNKTTHAKLVQVEKEGQSASLDRLQGADLKYTCELRQSNYMNNLNVDQIRTAGAKIASQMKERYIEVIFGSCHGWKCKLKATLSCDVHNHKK